MGKSSPAGANGYHYSFGIHMGLGRGPVNELVEIRVGDKTAWKGSQTDSGVFEINAPALFGGDKSEGGIVGSFNLLMGKPDQVAPPGLVSMLGHALPGFRGMVTAFFKGRIASNNPYPKAWKFRVRRTTKGWDDDNPWYPEKCKIVLHGDTVTHQEYKAWDDSQDDLGEQPEVITWEESPEIHAMNPAHILYETFTNRVWGRGLPVESMDQAAWQRAADTLFDEGFGMCVRWNRRDSLDSFAQAVIDHIGAAIYNDKKTSLLTIRLIRADYDPAALPIFSTDSGIREIKESSVAALGPGINETVVEFTDPITGKVRTVSAQNLASLQSTRGVFNSIKKSYSGIPTAGLALRLAQRDLRANAMALRKFDITFDRRAWDIPPGGVIRIRDTVRGIDDMVLRVGRVEDGTIRDGTIRIVAVQDVFALPLSSFIGNEPPNWVEPLNKPLLKRHRAFEMPYFMLAGAMNPADFAYVKDDAGYVGTVVEKPTDLSLAYNLYVRPDAPTEDDYPPTPTPSGP